MKITIEMGQHGRSLVIGHDKNRPVVSFTRKLIHLLMNLCAIPLIVIFLPLIWFGEILRKAKFFIEGLDSDLEATK